MSANFGSNQAPRMTALYLNAVNDAAPGVPLASSSMSGGIVQPYMGQLGAKITLSTAEALRLSNTATGTLYAGVYQYVQFKSDSVASNARGQIVFWSDMSSFLVTPDAAAANISKWAGITLNAVTKGNYGWIQILGKASVKAVADITKVGDAADGDLALVDGTPGNCFDVLADATGLTSVEHKRVVGVCLAAIAAGAVGPIQLQPRLVAF